jgi:hypothetical protein
VRLIHGVLISDQLRQHPPPPPLPIERGSMADVGRVLDRWRPIRHTLVTRINREFRLLDDVGVVRPETED